MGDTPRQEQLDLSTSSRPAEPPTSTPSEPVQAGLFPDESDEESTGAVREDEVEKFKEFLDSVSPDDFKAT